MTDQIEELEIKNPPDIAQPDPKRPTWTFWHTTTIIALVILTGVCGYWIPSRQLAWTSVLLLLGFAFLVAGHGDRGLWKGLFIDERNMISLSRWQIVCWTVLVLSAFLTAAFGNMRVYVKAIDIFEDSLAVSVAEGKEVVKDVEDASPDKQRVQPLTAEEAIARVSEPVADEEDTISLLEMLANSLAIAVPEELWLLMGISTTALLGTPLIRSNQTNKDPTKEAGGEAAVKDAVAAQAERSGVPEQDITTQGTVLVNRKQEDASFRNLFETETVGNVNALDLGKIQNFYFTAILVLVYGVMLFVTFRSMPIVDSLPALPASMLALLGISQVAYLGSKAIPQNVNAAPQEDTDGDGADERGE